MKGKTIKYWREDSFLSTNGTILRYDKAEHAILGFIGMLAALIYFRSDTLQFALLIWLGWNVVGLLWELFQVFVQKQVLEIKDIAANNAGFVLAGIIYLIIFG